MIRVLIFLLIATSVLADAPPSVRPAPLARQLRIVPLAYGSSNVHTNTYVSQWFADRMNGVIGTAGDTNVTTMNEMKARNTQFHSYYYDLYMRIMDTSASCVTYSYGDTLDMKAWATANGVNFETMIVRATGGPVTITNFLATENCVAPHASLAYTTPVGSIIQYRWYRNYQRRLLWNIFSRDYGRWLAKEYLQAIANRGVNGIMMDEQGQISPNANGIDAGAFWPYSNGGASFQWTSGYDNWTNLPTGNTNTQNRALAQKVFTRDTTASWVDGLMDSAEAVGMRIIPNGAGYWGPYNSLNNAYIADTLLDAFDGGLVGEYCYIYPTLSSQKSIIENSMSAAARWSRSPRLLFWEFIYAYTGNFNETGWDTTTSVPAFRMKNAVERMKMNLLGFWLSLTFPGQSTNHFGAKRNVNVNWNVSTSHPHGFGAAAGTNLDLPDSLACFDHNWLLWYGYPDSNRTKREGTDGAGQSYDLYNISMWKDAARTTLQTYAMGRWADGTNHGSTTAQLDTLPTSPTGQWFLVQPMYLNTSAPFLTTPKASGDTVYIKSTEWKIYVADTIQALAFPSGTPNPASLTIDSLTHDYFGESDSTRSRVVEGGGDSLIYAVGYTSFAALDSNATISTALSTNYRRLSPSGANTTDTLIILHTNAGTNAETYTEYRAVWHKTGSTYSSRVQSSRTFTSSPLAIGAQRVAPTGRSSISGSGVKIP